MSRNLHFVDIPDQLQSTSIGYSRFKKKLSLNLEKTEKIDVTSNIRLDTTKPNNNTTKPDMDQQKRVLHRDKVSNKKKRNKDIFK